MPKQITHKLSLNQVQLMRADMATNTSPHFVFLGKHIPYTDANGAIIDTTPPEIDQSVDGITYDIYRNMIYAKHIASTDVAPMVRYVEWESGTVYDQYDHTDQALSTKNWYVVTRRGTNRDVFVCLGNNNGQISTIAPNFNDTTPAESGGYETTDLYRWKYMYTVSQTDYNKFNMANYIPVIPNANVVANSVSGSIDYVTVTYGGTQYNSYANGYIKESVVGGNPLVYTVEPTSAANANFYKTCALTITGGQGIGQIRTINGYTVDGETKRVTLDSAFDIIPNTSSQYEITPAVVLVGDGDNFRGRALVNASSSNSIYKVEIIGRGSNYTWATATVAGNTGGGTTNFATLKPIISPYGGHGSNAADELRSSALGISVKFDSTESGGKVIDVNEFRTAGIIKRPEFANVTLTVASSVDFLTGQSIVQATTGAYGVITALPTPTTVRISNTVGYFATGYKVDSQSSTANSVVSGVTGQATYVDQTTKVYLTGVSGTYQLDEQITQANGTANAYLYSSNTSTGELRLTNVYGTFGQAAEVQPGLSTAVEGSESGASAQVSAVVQGDFVRGSGEVLYIDNKTPIAKATDQTETIKIILEF